MDDPLRLSGFPWVLVRVGCDLCGRRGEYRLARLAARYGPEATMDAVLRQIAGDCAWFDGFRKYEAKCGAHFLDLVRGPFPPDLPPGAAPLTVIEGGKRDAGEAPRPLPDVPHVRRQRRPG